MSEYDEVRTRPERDLTPERRRSSRSLLASKELDREAHRPIGLDEVLNVRRDALRPTHLDQHVGDWRRLSHEAQTALIDSQSTPHSACHQGSPQSVRHGVFIPRHRRSNDLQVGGNLGAIEQGARQRRANLLLACDIVVDPRGRPQRRPMPDMLTVEAIQHGDPITGVIALEPNDPTLHGPGAYGVPDTTGDYPEQPRPRPPNTRVILGASAAGSRALGAFGDEPVPVSGPVRVAVG